MFAYVGSAAFVAEDIAERGDVFDYVIAIVLAGVAACAEDAGYAWVVLESGTGCGEDVGVDVDGGAVEYCGESGSHE